MTANQQLQSVVKVMTPLAQKSQLADAIWKLGDCASDPTESNFDKTNHYVIDGGSLLHRIPWAKI